MTDDVVLTPKPHDVDEGAFVDIGDFVTFHFEVRRARADIIAQHADTLAMYPTQTRTLFPGLNRVQVIRQVAAE